MRRADGRHCLRVIGAVTASLAVAAALPLGGCAISAATTSVLAGPGPYTGVEIYMRDDDGRFARWATDRAGVLRFAGGLDAPRSNWSWFGSLTPAQSKAIDAIVREANWVQAPPKGDSQGPDIWEVRVQPVGASEPHVFTVSGTASSVNQVWAVFQDAGKARFAAELEKVPQGDLDRYIRERGFTDGDAEAGAKEDE